MNKKCTKCGEEKAIDEFGKLSRYRGGINTRCKICANKYQKDYRKKNPDKIMYNKGQWKVWYKNNADKRRAYIKNYNKNNLERIRELRKISNQKSCKRLSDTYIKGLITQYSILSFSDVPQKFVEAKRSHIQMKRQIKGE